MSRFMNFFHQQIRTVNAVLAIFRRSASTHCAKAPNRHSDRLVGKQCVTHHLPPNRVIFGRVPPRTPDTHEIDLKLAVATDHLPNLHRLLREQALERAVTRRLHSVYWDTPDLALHAAGLALRIRRVETEWIQTVKDRGTQHAGLFDRLEDETPVHDATPDVARIGNSTLRGALDGALAAGGGVLAPTFETDVRRSVRTLRRGDAEIEVCLDVGQVRTTAGDVPLSEVELELKAGVPGSLYDFALDLHERVPLRPAGCDKPTLGFRMLTGEKQQPMHARRLHLEPDATLDEALAQISASGLEQILANEVPAHDGHDPEGVHQLRVGVRRLRSLLSTLKEVLPEQPTDVLSRELRWLGGALGPARDLDVFLAEMVDPVLRARDGNGALKRLRDEAITMRAEAYEDVRRALESPRYTALALRFGRWCVDREWRQQALTPDSARLFAPARETAAQILGRRLTRARRLSDQATTPSERHNLRIELKKLRYAGDFFASVFPEKRTRRYLKRLSRLQDALGLLNDAATTERTVDHLLERMGAEASVPEQRAGGLIVGWWTSRAERDLTQLDERWKKLEATRPFWT